MADDTPVTEKLVPPYVAWKTFYSFIQHLRDKGVPNVIDRSTMTSMSGSSQSQLLAALKFLSLVHGTGAPTQALRDLCQAEGPAFGQKLKSVLSQAYREALSGIDLKTTTTGELAKRFQSAGINGGTVTTAISFLMSAAKEAGIEISAHVKAPSSGKRRPNGKRRIGGDDVPDQIPRGGERERPSADVQYFPIPLPQLGVEAGVTLPVALDSSSWQMMKTIIEAYAEAMIQRNVDDGEVDDA
jgi:hypothetical protein